MSYMRMAIFSVVACALMLSGCATTADRQQEKARIAAQVEQALADRAYVIDINMMYPQRGRAVNVTGNYSLEIRNDSLISYLPFFGRAYNVPYGGGKGLNFSAPLRRYAVTRAKADMTRVMAEVENDEDSYVYQIEVFDNGNATIYLQSREREPISYNGKIKLKE